MDTKGSRRTFLKRATITAGCGWMLPPRWAWSAEDIDARVAKIVSQTIGIDTHNHIDVPLTDAEMPGPDINMAEEMKRSGLTAICMTFATDYRPGDAYNRFLAGLASMDRQLVRNHMVRSVTASDVRKAHAASQPTVIQSVEGAHFLEGHVERVEMAYQRGLRHLGLLHDSDASVPLGDVYTNPPRFGGLTAFGGSIIRECNRLGILVDLAHADLQTTKAALKITTKPILVSHTGLDTQLGGDPRMAKMMLPRLISREQARLVADAGGAVGVWTHLADTPLDYAKNIRALADVIGVDHVCLGTDTKLTQPSPRPNASIPGGSRSDNAKLGPPTGPQRPHLGERTNEAWADQSVGFYYAVVDAMLKTGFAPDEIAKIGGGNFLRIFGEAVAK